MIQILILMLDFDVQSALETYNLKETPLLPQIEVANPLLFLSPSSQSNFIILCSLNKLRLTFFRVLLIYHPILRDMFFSCICKSMVRAEPYSTGQLVKMPHHPHPSTTCFPLLPQPLLTTLPMPLPVYQSSMYR